MKQSFSQEIADVSYRAHVAQLQCKSAWENEKRAIMKTHGKQLSDAAAETRAAKEAHDAHFVNLLHGTQQLANTHKAELAAAVRSHEEKMEAAAAAAKSELKQVNEAHGAEMAKVNEAHETEIEVVSADLAETRSELEEAYGVLTATNIELAELTRSRDAIADERCALQQKCAESEREIATLKEVSTPGKRAI